MSRKSATTDSDRVDELITFELPENGDPMMWFDLVAEFVDNRDRLYKSINKAKRSLLTKSLADDLARVCAAMQLCHDAIESFILGEQEWG